MFELLGLCLALAALLTVNAACSLITAALWGRLKHRARDWRARRLARLIFTLRVAPSVCAVLAITAVLLPAYLKHEPRASAEVVSVKLALLALLSAAGLLLAAGRALAAGLATRRLVAGWTQQARPLNSGLAIPAYRIEHRFPVIALVGALRPRLFVAEQVLAALSQAELAAALAHEGGHLAAGDNLKRALLRACRDALAIIPCGRALDRAWAEAAEAAADEFAARRGPATALDLAAALVKLARLAPAGAKPTLPASALLLGDEPGSIADRVQRLVRLAARPAVPAEPQPAPRFALAGLAILSALPLARWLAQSDALTVAHAWMERFVSWLQ